VDWDRTNLGNRRFQAMADKVQRIAENLYKGDIETVAELVQDALDAGMAPSEVLNDALLRLARISRRAFFLYPR
jgi:methanogenic corrinoid protein MtbC1